MTSERYVRNLTSTLRLNFSPRAKLILEVLMVLMCVGAVTGRLQLGNVIYLYCTISHWVVAKFQIATVFKITLDTLDIL